MSPFKKTINLGGYKPQAYVSLRTLHFIINNKYYGQYNTQGKSHRNDR